MRRHILALLLLAAPALVQASEYADLYVIPVAGHVTGQNGTTWMSDAAIQNFQSTPLTVQLVVIESGEGNLDNVVPLQSATGSSVTIPAGGTRILRDLLNGHRGSSQTIGAIMLGADRPFAVSSRSYATNALGVTQAESVMPVRDFLDNSLGDTNLGDAVAYVPGLTANARNRANLGFVAGSSSSGMSLQIMLRGADGASLGSKTFTIAGGGFTHVQFSSTAITTQSFDEGSAEFRILAGDGAVVPYASIVDNISSAAFYVAGQFPPNKPFTNSSMNAFRVLFERMRERE
jgi:hypothetical protein